MNSALRIELPKGPAESDIPFPFAFAKCKGTLINRDEDDLSCNICKQEKNETMHSIRIIQPAR